MEVVSVKATSGRRLLESGNTMVASVAVAATAANTNDFNPQTACAAIPPAEFQSALTTALKVLNSACTRLLELALLFQFASVSHATV